MFVFDAQESPHCSAEDFDKRDEERKEGRVLGVVYEDGVEDPCEAEDGVYDHDEVVGPLALEGEDVAEGAVSGIGLEEGEVHEEVPDCCHALD